MKDLAFLSASDLRIDEFNSSLSFRASASCRTSIRGVFPDKKTACSSSSNLCRSLLLRQLNVAQSDRA